MVQIEDSILEAANMSEQERLYVIYSGFSYQALPDGNRS